MKSTRLHLNCTILGRRIGIIGFLVCGFIFQLEGGLKCSSSIPNTVVHTVILQLQPLSLWSILV